MELNQNQYYQLEYPINDADGLPVIAVDAAAFYMYSGNTEIFTQDINNGGAFAGGVFTVTLDNTVDFNKTYYFEVWVIIGGKKYLTHKGSMTFNQTRGRINVNSN